MTTVAAERPQPPHDRRLAEALFRQMWSQALVTASETEDEPRKLRVEMPGRIKEEVKRQVRECYDILTFQRSNVDRKVDERVRLALRHLRVPWKEEIAQLNSRLDTLSKRIERLRK